MKYTNTITRNGETITLTNEEVRNIYRYQQTQYQIEDARHHVNEHILQHTDRNDDCWDLNLNTISDEDLLPYSSEEDIREFHVLLKLTDDDLEFLAENFDEKFDCNRDENSLWDEIITDFVKQSKA